MCILPSMSENPEEQYDLSNTPFVHLHVHTAYSLAEGAIQAKELVKHVAADGAPAVAMTDTNNMFGGLEFAMAGQGSGVQPILGMQIEMKATDGARSQLVLLVQNEAGYRNLCWIVSEAFMKSDDAEKPAALWSYLEDGHSDGLICLSGGYRGPIGQALLAGQKDKANELTEKLKSLFGDRLYIEIQRHHLENENAIEDDLIDIAYKHDLPLVATNDCYFATRDMHQAHDALLCIADGRYVTEDDRRKETPHHYLKSQDEMKELFADLPEAVINTGVIAQRCSYLLKPIDPILPPFDTGEGRNETEELRVQSEEGLQWRIENYVYEEGQSEEERAEIHKTYFERLEYELGIIEGMGFPGYFLIVSDFIKWSKVQDIPVGPGRGSGAGSVVAWALKITDLDPIALNLLFERFLNPERVSMPDFDVDFCQDRREEVIKYVQDKYGQDRVAQIITFGKLQARAVVRDVGRVLQMPYGQVDRISKMIPSNPANPVTLQEALDADPDFRLEIKKDETAVRLIDLALQLEGLYRHASTHAAGVVIGDRPLHELIPLYRDPRSDMPVTQFNMKYVEQAGLVKFDFLGLKTMTVVHTAAKLVKEVHDVDIDILNIPLDDEKTYELLSSGQTTGVFQVESAGMKDVLRKMRPNRFEDIIALVSLYRPGPMDNIPTYIAIKDGEEEPDYMHPVLKPILEETFGIMIYQEQVMQAAQFLAGYSLGGADLLRRAMGKKVVEEMNRQRKIFCDGSLENNDVPEEKANEIFDQINKFAGYGFNKSHAAAYALISYWTAWFKANYPVEFMAASMTWDMGNTDKLSIFKQDLNKMEIPLLLPDVNHSETRFKVENQSVRYALAALKGVGEVAMQSIVDEREKKGNYESIQNFADRISSKLLNKKQVEMLTAAGAFDAFNDNRAQVFSGSEIIMGHASQLESERESGQNSLFGDAGGSDIALGMPDLPDIPDWDPLEKMAFEFKAVGFYLSAHPLDTRQAQLKRLRILDMAGVEAELQNKNSGRFKMAGVVLKKQEKVSAKTGNKFAFLQVSDPAGVWEGMVFSDTLTRCRDCMNSGDHVLMTVEVDVKDEQLRYLVQEAKPLDDALANSVQQVRITIDGRTDIQKLHEELKGCDANGISPLHIYAPLPDGGQVRLAMPGLWQIPPMKRRALYKIKGVRQVEEL